MATFRYKARDKGGMAVAGMVDAVDQQVVTNSLRQLGYQVVSIQEHRGLSLFLTQLKRRLQRTRPQELVFFTRQLAMMVRSGLPLVDALAGMSSQNVSVRLRRTIMQVENDIKGGESFSEALERHPQLFSPFYVSMVRSGEASGMLDEILDRLATIGEQDLELRGQVRSALAYPVILLLLSIGIVSFMLLAVLPKFIALFEESGAQLPLPTVILLVITRIMQHYWWAILLILGVSGIAIYQYAHTTRGRYRIHRWLLRMPVFGQLNLETTMTRFSRSMASLLKSGIPAVSALAITYDLVTNVVLSNAIARVREAVIGGSSLAEPFRTSQVFPQIVVQMIDVGERTGSLGEMFHHLGSYYEGTVNQRLRTLTTVLEPMLLLFIGSLVGFVALSVLLPVFQLIKVFKH